MIIKIENSSGFFFIDEEDYDRVREKDWYVNKNGYVMTWPGRGERGILLHRFILNYTGTDTIDHIDRDPRNNSKSNLRIVPQWKNSLNTKLSDFNTTGVRGVSLNSNTGKYEAYIFINNRKKHLGHFTSLAEAKAEREVFEKQMLEDESLRVFSDKRANNKSGHPGVCFITRTQRWKAKINQQHLGYFSTKEEAIAARIKAEQEIGINK